MRTVLAALVLGASPAGALTLSGAVTDAITGDPVPGAQIELEATGAVAVTGPSGRFEVDAPDALPHAFAVRAPGYVPVRRVRQDPARPADIALVPWRLGAAPEGLRPGVPHPRLAHVPGGAIRLDGTDPNDPRRFYTLPATLPDTLRVARRFAGSCAGNPVQRIDEIPFEDYVAGVVPAEIGVFMSVPGGPEASRASFETFAVLARTYALWWYLRKGPTAEWHIDDTACNQRYEDDRIPFITQVVESVRGQILVKASDPTVVDKYEYAASCGRHGTRPEYQTSLVPDDTGLVGCTRGGWCGHDNCAAHEDNPDVPGADRCLVRGTCQWGSLEWSFAGKPYTWILDHYEPNLTLLDLSAPPAGNLVGLVREGDIYTGPNISGAEVTLHTGASTITGDNGRYRFEGLPYGPYEITARAPGYLPLTRSRSVSQPGDTWASIALVREPVPDAGPGPVDAGSAPPDAGTGERDGGSAGGGAPVITGGCACSASTTTAPSLSWILAPLLIRRRRR